jgi:putative membrane protein
MIRFAIIIAYSVMAFGSANAQSFFERVGINSFFGISPSTQDFVTQVAQREIFQIEISKLARQRGRGATKQFSEKMLEEHRVTSSQLKALVDSGNVRVTLPATLGSVYQFKLDHLKNLSDVDFEKEFDRAQVDLHAEIVSLFERYGSGGSHPDLKIFAYRHLQHILEHWRLAKASR